MPADERGAHARARADGDAAHPSSQRRHAAAHRALRHGARGPRRPAHPRLRGRGLLRGAGGEVGPRAPLHQRLWPHRGHRLRLPRHLRARWPEALHRRAPGQHAPLRTGRAPAPGAHRRARRALHRRRGPGARLPAPPGADRRALHPRRLQWRARRAPLPHGRPRALEVRRHAGLPGPHRLPGEAARLPHRAGRSRSRAACPPVRRGRRGRGAQRRPLRRAARRLRRRPVRSAGRPGAAHVPRRAAAGVHGAVGIRGAGHAAPDSQRQGGPQGPARPRGPAARRQCLRGTAHAAGGEGGGGLRPRAGPGASGRQRRLLHPGRTLTAGHPRGLAPERVTGRGAVAADPVRGVHGLRARRPPRRCARVRSGAAHPGHRPGATHRRAPAVLRAAAPVAHRPARARQLRVQHAVLRAPGGLARRELPAPCPGRAGPTARSAAHALHAGAGRAPPGHQPPGPAAAGHGGPERTGARGRPRGAGTAPPRGDAAPVHPHHGPAAARAPAEAGRHRARAVAQHAPHRLGRLVHGRAGA